jgi:hypothetical protein
VLEHIDIEASLERHFTSWPDEKTATRLQADFLNRGIAILRDIEGYSGRPVEVQADDC